MVIEMEEHDWALTKCQKQSVAHFHHFGDEEQEGPEGTNTIWMATVADGVDQSMVQILMQGILKQKKNNELNS
jgi:hypothetical protein